MHPEVLSRETIRKAKMRLLQMHFESGVGHIGGNLSALDILLCLYHSVMRSTDAFVLSKGHSAGALYVTLWSLGKLTDRDLLQFHNDTTKLSGHPPPKGIQDVLFATGSLGHGLGLASGLALARKLKGESGRVFCLLSDGEWNEGSTWEALIFANQQKLDNLVFIIDANGLQGFGTTREVANIEPLADKLRSFGVTTHEIDGHDPVAIVRSLSCSDPGPRAVVARTIKGKGVSFMENRMEWHYLPLTEAQYHEALEEVSKECATPSAAP
jgi:transketolase